MEKAIEKTHQETLLTVMSKLPIVSTQHVSQLFQHHLQPQKTASKMLVRLKKQKLVESMWRASQRQTKIWRLSKQGMLETGATFTPVPLTSMKVENYLGFADVYFTLGQPKTFYVELREPFPDGTHFDPDIFTIYNKKAYLIEVQKQAQSQKVWAKKWSRWNDYFNHDYHLNASWQRHSKTRTMFPDIVVVTKQVKEQVSSGWNVLEGMKKKELTVIKKISDLTF